MHFEWDAAKDAANIEKHGVDFDTARLIWEGFVLERPSSRTGTEQRILAVGEVDGRELVVIYTWRGEVRRIISARRAHRNERAEYRAQEAVGTSQTRH